MSIPKIGPAFAAENWNFGTISGWVFQKSCQFLNIWSVQVNDKVAKLIAKTEKMAKASPIKTTNLQTEMRTFKNKIKGTIIWILSSPVILGPYFGFTPFGISGPSPEHKLSCIGTAKVLCPKWIIFSRVICSWKELLEKTRSWKLLSGETRIEIGKIEVGKILTTLCIENFPTLIGTVQLKWKRSNFKPNFQLVVFPFSFSNYIYPCFWSLQKIIDL